MIEPIRKSWRRWHHDRRLRRDTADLPDYILRDIGLERGQVRERAMHHILHSGH